MLITIAKININKGEKSEENKRKKRNKEKKNYIDVKNYIFFLK